MGDDMLFPKMLVSLFTMAFGFSFAGSNVASSKGKVVLTDDQLLAIDKDSQAFAELSMSDKLRFYQLENSALKTANEKLTENMPDADGLRITEKGVLSLTMPHSWPASYYRDQWELILSKVSVIRAALDKDAKGNREIINKPPKERGRR